MSFIRSFAPALLAFGLAGAAWAASPGSPEWYIGYGKESLAAGDFARAADQFRDALRLDPGNVEAKALLAQAQTGGRKGQAAVAPRVDGGRTGSAIRVGDVVEIDRFSDDKWGAFGRVTEVKEPSSACPRYYVRYPASDPNGLVFSFVCGRVRPTSEVKAQEAVKPKVADKGGPLATGTYACDTGSVGGYQARGALTLRADGGYDHVRGGGRYAYDARSGKVRFISGYFATTKASGTFLPGKRTSQIDIDFPGPPASYWSCGRNN